MAKKKGNNRKSRALNSTSKTFEQLDNEMQQLAVQKSLNLEKAFTSNDPQAILDAQSYLEKNKGKKGTPDVKSWMFLPDDYAYTGKGYKETIKSVSFEALKNVSKLFIVKIVQGTRIDQVKNFLAFTTDDQKEGFTITKKRGLFDKEASELSKSEQKEVTKIVKFLESCGNNSKWDNYDDFIEFIVKILTDSLTYDQLGFENVRSRNGNLDKFLAVDASMIRQLDSNDPRYVDQFKDMIWRRDGQDYVPKYCMAYNGQILRHPTTGQLIMYYPWELGYGIRNKTTDVRQNGYGTSELETGIELITWILWSFQYNGNFFKQGSQPKGFVNVKDGNLDNGTVNEFRNSWRQMMSGVGNCLHGDTFVITPEGRKELKDFFINGNEDKKTKIWTGKKFEDALVYKSKKKTVNKITLNNGMSIKSSPEHRFKTVDVSGDIVWKERKDLKEGDFLMINKKSVESKDILYYSDIEIESDLFELIGWMIGDGWLGENIPKKKRASLFYHQDIERCIQKYHTMILNKYNINNLPDEKFRTEDERVDRATKYGFKSVAKSVLTTNIVDSNFVEFLHELGFTSSKKGKTIPNFMFSCNPKYRRALLRGFFSADAHVSAGRYVQMAIVPDMLRQQTKELLLIEGVRCGNHEGNERKNNTFGSLKEGYRLLIKDNDVFFNKIGLLQDHKQFKNNKLNYYSVKESLPVSLCKKEVGNIKTDMKLRYKETKSRLCNRKVTDDISAVLTDKETFSFNRFKHLYDTVENTLYNYKTDSEVFDFHFEKIIKLEEFSEKVEMYDVEIFDNENQFIANGILTHNSHKIPVFEGIDLEWVDLQKGNRDMEFNQWVEFLMIVFCSLYKIDPSELGFNFQQAKQVFGQDGQKERLDHSKKKGLKPLLVFLQNVINKNIISEINPEYEFKFTGIDIEDEDAQVELDAKKLKEGMVSQQSVFEKYMGRELDEKNDIILNAVYQQAQQAKMMGNPEMNQMVDEESGEQEPTNAFEEFAEKSESDPIIKSSLDYINKTLN